MILRAVLTKCQGASSALLCVEGTGKNGAMPEPSVEHY